MGRYGSKDSSSRRTSKLNNRFKSYDNFNDVFRPLLIRVFMILNQSTVDNWGVSRGRFVAVGISDRLRVTCDRWKVTCHRSKVTCEM